MPATVAFQEVLLVTGENAEKLITTGATEEILNSTGATEKCQLKPAQLSRPLPFFAKSVKYSFVKSFFFLM